MSLADMVVDVPLIDPEEAARDEWFRKRSGKFTCSKFGDLMGVGRKKDEAFSQTALNYIYQIAAERLGSYCFGFDSSSTQWGKDHEAEAIAEYCALRGVSELVTGVDCFRQLNDYTAGTPDGLIDPDGCIEVKCPYTPQEHMRTIAEHCVPDRYVWQVHGHMLITGAKWCDFISYDPRLTKGKLFVLRVERDETALDVLSKRLELANQKVLEVMEAVK